ncbi:hypothetical protein PS3A_23740 [Pseudomonas sp. 3A(2025)]
MRFQNFFSKKLIHEVNLKLMASYPNHDASLPIELQGVISPYKKTPAELRAAFEEAARRLKQA